MELVDPKGPRTNLRCNPALFETAENDRIRVAYQFLARYYHWKSLEVKKMIEKVCRSAVLTHLLVLPANSGYLGW